ncbi:MAG: hypothetical protein CVT65_02580 [Actinobacteria bacterium HGW-Actinobacteria-5]|nr:MAG: hypothetical protein CVT65_02580 [Actinobacteria bacterium HGW-Actinobacteria-5]
MWPIILACALLVACTPAGAAAPSSPAVPTGARLGGPAMSLRAMTYNVLGGPVPDDWFPLIARDELTPMARAPGMVAKVELADPDVVGLQEFVNGSESATWIEQHLPGYTWLPGPDNHAIALRTSRFAVAASGSERVNTAGEQGAILDRYVDWVRVRDRGSGRTALVLNLHAHAWQSPQLAATRSLAIDRLVDLFGRLDPGLHEPLVLLGDFNARDDETRPVYRDHLDKLVAAGLVDARRVAEKDASDVPRASSLQQMTARVAGVEVAKVVRRTDRRIDYVWVPKGTTVRAWAVLSGPGVGWQRVRGLRVPTWTGIVPSDHSPVFADLRFR